MEPPLQGMLSITVSDLQSTPKSNPPEGAATPASQSSGNNARTAVAAKSGQSLQLVAGIVNGK